MLDSVVKDVGAIADCVSDILYTMSQAGHCLAHCSEPFLIDSLVVQPCIVNGYPYLAGHNKGHVLIVVIKIFILAGTVYIYAANHCSPRPQWETHC